MCEDEISRASWSRGLKAGSMEVASTRIWEKRLTSEATANLRASPLDPLRTRHTRDARLRTELELILRSDPRLNLRPRSVLEQQSRHRSPRKQRSSKKRGEHAVLTARPEIPREIGVHTVLPVKDAGSLTSRQLRERSITYKNMESDIWLGSY